MMSFYVILPRTASTNCPGEASAAGDRGHPVEGPKVFWDQKRTVFFFFFRLHVVERLHHLHPPLY